MIQESKAEETTTARFFSSNKADPHSVNENSKTYKEKLSEHYHGIMSIAVAYKLEGLKYSLTLSNLKRYVFIFESPEKIDKAQMEACQDQFASLLGIGVEIISEHFIRDTMKNSKFMKGYFDGVLGGEDTILLTEFSPIGRNDDNEAVANNIVPNQS